MPILTGIYKEQKRIKTIVTSGLAEATSWALYRSGHCKDGRIKWEHHLRARAVESKRNNFAKFILFGEDLKEV